MKALGQAVLSQIAAGIGNLKVLAFSGIKDESHWVHGDHRGQLRRPRWLDGMDAVDTLMPIPATTRSRTSRHICRCACGAANCARTCVAPASGGAGSARSGNSNTCPTVALRSRATATAGVLGDFRRCSGPHRGAYSGARRRQCWRTCLRTSHMSVAPPRPFHLPRRRGRVRQSLRARSRQRPGRSSGRPALGADGKHAYGVVLTATGHIDQPATEVERQARRRQTGSGPALKLLPDYRC